MTSLFKLIVTCPCSLRTQHHASLFVLHHHHHHQLHSNDYYTADYEKIHMCTFLLQDVTLNQS